MRSGETLLDVVRHLRTQVGDAPTDAELLARYARHRDEDAFTALVRRHGGLVLGVARRQLADPQQAEDLFQATFLALARAAGRLDGQPSLVNWLYTVALRQARKARALAARRASLDRTRITPPTPPADPLAEITGRELVGLIDHELARLPENYRLPLLLCCIEGLSREEAARRLGWSQGAVKGRLERARRRLADRLARRGLAPSVALLAPLSPPAVPDDLLARTTPLAASPWSKSLPAAVVQLAAAGGPTRLLPALALLAPVLAIGLTALLVYSGETGPTKPAPPPPAARAEAPRPLTDPLPAHAVRRFGTSRFRHGTAIETLAVSADGRFAVASSGNRYLGTVRAFDLTDGRTLYELDALGFQVEAVALSPDGRTLATKQGTTVHLRDAATGRELRKIPLPKANPRSITNWMTFSPDGKFLAVASKGNVIHLVDLEKGTVARSFPHDKTVFAVAFSPDGKTLAGGGYDSAGGSYFARLWDVATGKEIGRCSGKRGFRTLAFSPDGKTLAGGGDDGRLRLWDVATGKIRRTFPADGRRIRSVAFAPDGKTVAAAGDSIRLYDPATDKERLRIPRKAVALHFSADGKVLTAAVAGAIHRWDPATGRALTPQDAGDSGVDKILTTPDGRRVLTYDQQGVIHIWDRATGKHLNRFQAGYQRDVALSPDGRRLVWVVGDPGVKFPDPANPRMIHDGARLQVYDLATGRTIDRFPGFKGDAWEIAFTPDGRTLVTTDRRDGTVRLWDVAAGKVKQSFQAVRAGEKANRYFFAQGILSPDGKTLAVAYDRADRTSIMYAGVVVRLWDLTTGRELHQLTGHMNRVEGLAFSPDGKLLATCGENPLSKGRGRGIMDAAFVWDVASGKRIDRLTEGLAIGASHVAFSPDGRTLATASADGVIRLWERASWTVRAKFKGHRDYVTALHFAADGRLFSGGLDTTVLAWDVRPAKTEEGTLTAGWDSLTRIDAAEAFKAQGRLLASPAEAVKFLAARLKPAEAVDPKRIARLIADLDSGDFTTREKATEELGRLGRSAEQALREARKKGTSPEARRRADKLLARLEKSATPPEELRGLRAVEVLEWIATPEARRVLATLAKGDRNAALTKAAADALARLRPGDGGR